MGNAQSGSSFLGFVNQSLLRQWTVTKGRTHERRASKDRDNGGTPRNPSLGQAMHSDPHRGAPGGSAFLILHQGTRIARAPW